MQKSSCFLPICWTLLQARYRTRWRSSNENLLFEVGHVVKILNVCGGTQVPMPSIVWSVGLRAADVHCKPWPHAKISRSGCEALREHTSRTCFAPISTIIAASSLVLCSLRFYVLSTKEIPHLRFHKLHELFLSAVDNDVVQLTKPSLLLSMVERSNQHIFDVLAFVREHFTKFADGLWLH